MISNDIIKTLGAGSGIDTNSLVTQLTAIERSAPQDRITSAKEKTETQISDFGILSSALSTLQDAAKTLTEPEGLFSKSAAFTESDALVPTELDTDVEPGVYSFVVNNVAQAQTLAFDTFASKTDAVGEGVLTFNFGTWGRDGSDDPTTFTADASQSSQTVTIDSSNNTLEGLRNAINDADIGVQASIVNNGSGYLLSIVAASGVSNELEITVAEAGGTPTNTDGSDLSRFAFNTGVTDFDDIEAQKGIDASLTMNGIEITRSSNSIDDVVGGLSLDILKAAPTETVTVTVSEDKAFAEQTIRDFISAYNTFLEVLEPLMGSSEVEGEDGSTSVVVGSLARDSLAKSTLSSIRSLIASSVPGLADSNFTSITNVGIRTELDGTLAISEDEFEEAFAERFEDVQKLFAPRTVSSDPNVYVNSFNDGTTSGEYDIVITTPPSRGVYTGNTLANIVFPNFDSSAPLKDYNFEVTVNGIESSSITIPVGTYEGQSDFASAIQTAINADAALVEAGATVLVSYDSDNDNFLITSTKYDVSSQVTITNPSTDTINDLGLIAQSGTTGSKVSGTVNGLAGFGTSNVLLPALGEAGEGLAMVISENATSTTINFSRGFGGELERLIDSFLENDGLIANREEVLGDKLESFDVDQEDLDRRMEAFEERLRQQYIAMERILSGLNSSGTFLENLLDTLPFTAKNN